MENVAFAIYMKKKNETEPNVFYNLILGKKQDGWNKFLLKYTPDYEKSKENELHWIVENLSGSANAGKCSSYMVSITRFYCP